MPINVFQFTSTFISHSWGREKVIGLIRVAAQEGCETLFYTKLQ